MKRVRLPVEKVAVVSTAHISLRDNTILAQHARARMLPPTERQDGLPDTVVLHVDSGQYGYYLHVLGGDRELVEQQKKDMRQSGCSTALIRLVDLARRQGIQMLQFDCAGNDVPGLERFDW